MSASARVQLSTKGMSLVGRICLRTLLLVLSLLLASAPVLVGTESAHAQSTCDFVLGFKELRDRVEVLRVGACWEDQQFEPGTGNAL